MKKLIILSALILFVFIGYGQKIGPIPLRYMADIDTNNIAKTQFVHFISDISNIDSLEYSNDTLYIYQNGNTYKTQIVTGASLTITTNGTSGVAVLNGDTLNIPNYTYTPKDSVLTLTGTTPTLDAGIALNAGIALTGNTVLTITNLANGEDGSIEVVNGATAYTLDIDGSTGYTTEVKKGTKSAINSAISSRTTVIFWRTGSTLFYGFLYDN